MTPLHVAAENGRVEMIDFLYEKKAHTSIKDKNGVSNEYVLLTVDYISIVDFIS